MSELDKTWDWSVPVYTKRTLVGWAKVDMDDYPEVVMHLWRGHGEGYATRYDGTGKHHKLMHRLLLDLGKGDRREVDHINGDRLDNRRRNLRIVNRQVNMQNVIKQGGTSSRFIGVYRSRSGRWIAQAKLNGEVTYLGTFDDELDAARVARAWREENLPGFRPERHAVVA